ncbi:MAG: MarR family EPS-associated transcriptional regulator [Candidatus Pelagibacter sp.]|mgnify:CR=1 FL=1|nr:MarR family EPS-associated transcriptional regulator [Candidatus Pelagibacter sp.]|tara:strand:- start:1939 stop:2262 length:324 start_codon:yes stop_codon:yes gene_type:complete
MHNKLENNYKVLKEIQNNPNTSQREMAKSLGFSLGKLNYCIQALKKKGLVKINNFKKNPKKMNYAYILTPKGIKQKTKLTINFMVRKMTEYDELKKEFEEQKLLKKK